MKTGRRKVDGVGGGISEMGGSLKIKKKKGTGTVWRRKEGQDEGGLSTNGERGSGGGVDEKNKKKKLRGELNKVWLDRKMQGQNPEAGN